MAVQGRGGKGHGPGCSDRSRGQGTAAAHLGRFSQLQISPSFAQCVFGPHVTISEGWLKVSMPGRVWAPRTG